MCGGVCGVCGEVVKTEKHEGKSFVLRRSRFLSFSLPLPCFVSVLHVLCEQIFHFSHFIHTFFFFYQ